MPCVDTRHCTEEIQLGQENSIWQDNRQTSTSIMNLYSTESWSISTALCVLSGNAKISSSSTVVGIDHCWAPGCGDCLVVNSRLYSHCMYCVLWRYSQSATTFRPTPAGHRTAAVAARMMMWHPPVSTGHSFSPPSMAHSFFQRSASGRYCPLPGMVRSCRTVEWVSKR